MSVSRNSMWPRAAGVLALPQTWTTVAVVLVAALCLWGWWLMPARWPLWAAVAGALPVFWGFMERRQHGTLRAEGEQILQWHRTVFAVVGLILALKLAPGLAMASGQLDPAWGPLTERVRWIATGVAWAYWGNYLPKLLSPWPAEDEPFAWQRVHRFVGWVFSMMGAGIVVTWLTLPVERAEDVSEGLIIAAMLLALTRKLYSVATHQRPSPHAGSGERASIPN